MQFTPKMVFSKALNGLKLIKYAPVEKSVRLLLPAKSGTNLLYKYHVWRSSHYPELQATMRQILAANPDNRGVIIFLPSLDWDKQLFQRPQQLAKALAHQGALVFYTQLPKQTQPFIKPLGDRLFLCSCPLENFSSLPNSLLYVLTWNSRHLLKFDQPKIVYDYLDDIAAFKGDKNQLTEDHHRLLKSAELVITTANSLYQDAIRTRPDTLCVPNGVDFIHFNPADNLEGLENPADIRVIKKENKPIIGYYGALAEWFDYDLMHQLAQARLDLNFVLLGPDHDGSLGRSGLCALPNVKYLGPKPYAELPAYLASFDIAILPFKVNKITESTSPVKLFEYMAGCKPIVSTPLREVVQYSSVLIGRDMQEFSLKLDEALALKNDPRYISQLEQTARDNDWNLRAKQILMALNKHR
jgi:glycosyltransferase involved in cell wall biosynthesis